MDKIKIKKLTFLIVEKIYNNYVQNKSITIVIILCERVPNNNNTLYMLQPMVSQ